MSLHDHPFVASAIVTLALFGLSLPFLSADPLPSLVSTQIGPTNASGSYTVDATTGIHTVRGAGTDIWGTSDSFFFVHRTLSGDFEVQTRIHSIQWIDSWAKAGLMIRQSTAPNSPHALLALTPGNGITLQHRPTEGSASSATTYIGAFAPMHLRLRRIGSTVSAFASGDGATWIPVGTLELEFNADVLVGFAVTSRNTWSTCEAIFSQLKFNTEPADETFQGHNLGAATPFGLVDSISQPDKLLLKAGGTGLSGISDSGFLYSRDWSGDAELTVRIDSFQVFGSDTKAGLTLRDGLAPGARHVSIYLHPWQGIKFERRLQPDAPTLSTIRSNLNPPRWLRLTRHDNLIRAFVATDQGVWNLIGVEELDLPASLRAGLVGTSNSTGAYSLSTITTHGFSLQQPEAADVWLSQDIGQPPYPGSATISGATPPTFTITSAGTGFQSAADGFHFLYRSSKLSGDFSFSTRLSYQEPTWAPARAGVMARANLTPGSPMLFLAARLNGGFDLLFRSQPNTTPTVQSFPGTNAYPRWMRLLAEGPEIHAEISNDGESWTRLTSVTLSSPTGFHLGMASTTGHEWTLGTSIFGQTTLSDGDPAPPLLPESWQLQYFGTTGIDPDDDPDGDGFTNLQEYQNGTDPTDFYNGTTPTLVIVSGNNQTGPVSSDLPDPLLVKVRSPSGTPLANAPVTFTAPSDLLLLRPDLLASDFTTTITLRTNASGLASVYLRLPDVPGAIQIEVTAGQAGSEFTATASLVPTNDPPSIQIVAPRTINIFPLQETVNLSALATDPDDNLSHVEWFINGVLVSTDSQSPSLLQWTPPHPGRFVVLAKAFDQEGLAASDSRVLEIKSPPSETLAFSPAAGGRALELPGESDTVSAIPFSLPPIFGGRIQAIDDSQIIAQKTPPWIANQFISTPHVLQILEGPLEGAQLPVIGNGSTHLSVSSSTDLSALQPGTRFFLTPAWTLAALLPPALFQESDGQPSPQILLPDPSNQGASLPLVPTFTHNTSGWQSGSVASDDAILDSNDWFMVRRESSINSTWILIGDVPHASRALHLPETSSPTDIPISLGSTRQLSPSASGLMKKDILSESVAPNLPTDFLIGYLEASGPVGRTPDAHFFRRNGAWVRLGDPTPTDLAWQPVLNGMSGWFLRRSGPATSLHLHQEHATP